MKTLTNIKYVKANRYIKTNYIDVNKKNNSEQSYKTIYNRTVNFTKK